MSADSMCSRIVVVGVDNTKTSEHAFDWYVKNLHKPDSRVILVHCVEVPNLHVYPSVFLREEIMKAEFEKAVVRARGIEEKYKQKVKELELDGDYVTLPGAPGTTVARLANEVNAELVIVGTRNRGTVKRAILGSNSNQIVNRSHCPVITVRKSVPV